MLYVITCLDKAEHGEVRSAHRAAHRAWLEAEAHRMFACGPLLNEDQEAPMGSLLIVEAVDRADAEAFATSDPYNKAGLFRAVDIHRWHRTGPASAT